MQKVKFYLTYPPMQPLEYVIKHSMYLEANAQKAVKSWEPLAAETIADIST